MNIIIREFKSKLKTFLIWTIIIVVFALLGFSEGSAFVGESSLDVQQLMDSMPDELLSAFSMDGFDMSTPEGYYGIMVIYFALALAIYSVMTICSSVISEERDKTAEFSLVLPIKRHQLLTAKLIVVSVYGVLLNIISIGCTCVFGMTVDASDTFYEYVLISAIAVLLIQVLFIAVGFLIGCVFKNHKRAGSLSVSIILAAYFLSVLEGLDEKLEFFTYITPFKFFDFYEILETNSMNITYVIITLILSAVLITFGYIGYGRRDIHI